ncbi:magnesium transporter CorA [Candidatus Levyibacteriota bacterium]|nr:hypothetical protein [Candidatus Levybacteria bacterium]GDX61779.1 magnesium transporter CorA [Candidatus Levybacteria bacterium]
MNIQQVNFNNTSFINVTNPQETEMKHLHQEYEFDLLHLEDYLKKTQISQIETFEKYSLIILDIPILQSPSDIREDVEKSFLLPLPGLTQNEKKKRIITTQINFFIGKDYLVVLHEGNMPTLNDLFIECQKTLKNREEFLGKGPIFLLYRIIDLLVDSCFPILNDTASIIDKIDKDLEYTPTDTTIENISLTRRNIVVMQTLIKPLYPLFRGVEEGKYQELYGYMKPYWANIVDHLQKISERLEDSRELIEGIAQSNESFLTARNNELVKFLTVITSISFPFIIVNNLYSMNVIGLPFSQNPNIVWILFGVIALGSMIILFYFKHRRWI